MGWLVAACLALHPLGAQAERFAQARFGGAAQAEAWAFEASHPDGVTRADEASGPRREDGRWVYRIGSATSVTRFEPVELAGATHPTLSWVFRVERARWDDDAFFEIRVRLSSAGGESEERRVWRWDAEALRGAKPGRGNFQSVALPEGVDRVGVVIQARAAASRGSAWFDLFDLRLDGTPTTAPPDAPPTWVRPPYLQSVSTDSATVAWRTRYPRRAALRWTIEGEGAASVESHRVAREASTDHAIEMGPLRPDTWVRYEIDLDGSPMAQGPAYRFRSAPAGRVSPASPIGIWVIGDSGACGLSRAGCEHASAVRDAFARARGSTPASLWFLLGDNAYPHGTDWEYSEALFQVYPRVAAATALWPVPGNHDFYAADSATQSGVYYDAFHLPVNGEAGGVASGTEAYYSFDWGPLHVVALDSQDSDRSRGGAMASWLDADLRAARDATWTIAMFHHPPYSHGSHDSDDPRESGGRMVEMRQVFVPILERHGVDLVLAGHSHGYERSALIGGHTGYSSSYQEVLHRFADGSGAPPRFFAKQRGAAGKGTVYVVVGSSSEASRRMRPHPVMVKSIAALGSLWVEIDGDTLRGRFIDAEARILDDFEIRKTSLDTESGQVALLVSVLVILSAAGAAVWAGRRRG